ncbi:MAG: hypothetical protein N4Q30_02555 [Neisseriaceae bacterium]|nr:hypothetical protein [Neisseriaceae bacterium]
MKLEKLIYIGILIATSFLLGCSSTPQKKHTVNNQPEDVVNHFMYLITQHMDFEELMTLGDYPNMQNKNELNFYLLEMRKLIPYEKARKNSTSSCNQFEKKLNNFYDKNQLNLDTNLSQERQNCLIEMNQLGNKIIAEVYDLGSGIQLTNKIYNQKQNHVVLEYKVNDNNWKIRFPLIKKNNQWYFEDFGYEYIVNHLGYL